jgi:hypothetical protein
MYAKLFASIYQGTLRGNTHGLVVFTNMLAHADKEGWVDIHPRAIAEEVGLSIPQVHAAIAELESPDPESRSPEKEGRRIVRMDEHRAWGWIVVNYCKYRAIRSEDDRREQNKLAQQRFRDRSKQDVSNSKPASASVSHESAMSAHTEVEVEADTYTEDKSKTIRASRYEILQHLGELGVSEEVAKDWLAMRKQKKAIPSRTAILMIETEAGKAGISVESALKESCARGWTGFKADWITTKQNAPNVYKSIHDQRAETIAVLTGRKPNVHGTERDITGESKLITN